MNVEALNAVTLLVSKMEESVKFYLAAGFRLGSGGPNADFSTFIVGEQHLNLTSGARKHHGFWGRIVFHVDNVDAVYRNLLDHGLNPQFAPRDADWGERYFHIRDPDGHEISFAQPI
jgi:catechol 2,3-dioxygenase-like lactoylglutathione lyase family enzyme